jgi:FkbM family methyltransferase
MQLLTKHQVLPLVHSLLPSPTTIIEAGAFNGQDTLLLARQFPQATIHAFEPVPEIFELLTQNSAHMPNIKRHPYALSDHTGTAQFYVSEKPSRPGKPFQAGSLLKPKERLQWSDAVYTSTIQVPTITLDEWAAQNSITHIDFAWLDMQGLELNVLKASPRMLATMQLIYTEVEFIEAYEGQYQYPEVKAWLESNGFTAIARDFTDQPDWFFGNVLFRRHNFV